MAKRVNFNIDLLQIYENNYEDSFEYNVSGKMSAMFVPGKDNSYAGFAMDDDSISKYSLNNTYSDKFRFNSKSYKDRPECLKGIVTKQDIEAGTVQPAIDDFVDLHLRNNQDDPRKRVEDNKVLWQLVYDLTDVNLQDKLTTDFINQSENLELRDKRKVIGIEYNHDKPTINTVSIEYDGENGPYYETFKLNKPVTNKDISRNFPFNLSEFYANFDKYLKDDYNNAVKLASAVFGFDVETLKGANVE